MSNKRQYKSVSLFTAGVITTVSITLVLFLLGSTFLVWFTGTGFSSYLKENMGVSIELADNADEASVEKIQKRLENNPYVKYSVYVSKDEVKKQLVEDLGRDPEEVLGYDPARSYIDVFIKSDYMNPDSIKLVETSLKKEKLVKNVVYSQDDIAYANSNLTTLGTILMIFTVILIVISFTLIRSIIQLNIYSKRFLINTMQLVGATNAFIRRPFMLRMCFCGFVAGILANMGIAGMVYYTTKMFPIAVSIVDETHLYIVFGLVLVFGVLITIFATVSAVNRFLRMTTNKLYRS